MKLEELGKEYSNQYNLLMKRVEEIKKEYDNATPEIQRKSRIRIRELITTATYLKHTADKLLSYYNKTAVRRKANETKHLKP